MGFKTLLSIPPDYDHNFPPLGTPALSAYLKKNGMACAQTDLNIAYRGFIPDNFFSDKLEGRCYSAFLPRDESSRSGQLPYGNHTNSSFYFCERLLSSEYLWRYLEDRDENTFYKFYETSGILDRLKKDDIGLFGISVISPTQAIASLTLGLLIKKHLPHIHVTIGGQWVTLYRDAILEKKELFRCFDSMIVFEGESALLELARRLETKRDISSIPNVIEGFRKKTVSVPIFRATSDEDMNSLPCPNFDGLPLREYNGCNDGRISLTYETSRGCYWSKCAYCVDLPLPKPSYRRKDPKLVAKDMRQLKERYGAKYLLFGDPGLSPRQMREISEEILKDGVEMEWWTMARLDPGFDRKLFELAHKAGLRQVNFGFESANDRVCKLLDKGNYRDRSSRIIKDCALSGIKVDLQTMIGLPDENFQDGLDTVDFLVSHKEFIDNTTFNTYYLTPFNFVHQNPEKYGIEYDKDKSLPFGFFIPFKNKRGMDKDQAELLQKIYHSMVSAKTRRETAGIC
jgi:radical SAM superfamily enzyme YgiQ (UPF0313 family)